MHIAIITPELVVVKCWFLTSGNEICRAKWNFSEQFRWTKKKGLEQSRRVAWFLQYANQGITIDMFPYAFIQRVKYSYSALTWSKGGWEVEQCFQSLWTLIRQMVRQQLVQNWLLCFVPLNLSVAVTGEAQQCCWDQLLVRAQAVTECEAGSWCSASNIVLDWFLQVCHRFISLKTVHVLCWTWQKL